MNGVKMKSLKMTIVPAIVLALGLLGLSPSPLLAGNLDTYQFLAGAAPAEGPDVATAHDGSTVTLSGSGTFKAGPNKTASGGGTYTIKDPVGNVVAFGTWTVTGILGFVDYGPLPEDPTLHGGQAQLAVNLVGFHDGVITITCLIGSPPPSKDEGIKLVLDEGGNFNRSTSGETLFITP